MQRFFVSPALLKKQPVVLVGDQAHQVRKVLRLQPGDRVTLLDNAGWACEAALSGYDKSGRPLFEIVSRYEARGEPRVHITLYQAVLKGERFEWALQKCTEVGISVFVPLVCQRSVIGDLAAIEQKRARWERIIREAAEQSGRGRLPVLAPAQLFPAAVRQGRREDMLNGGGPLRLIPWEAEREAGLRAALDGCNGWPGKRIELYVGPEGGFTDAEISMAREHGMQPVTLGPRILRAETAGMVAAATIFYHAGDMDPQADT